jgi:hypothetical protein
LTWYIKFQRLAGLVDKLKPELCLHNLFSRLSVWPV